MAYSTCWADWHCSPQASSPEYSGTRLGLKQHSWPATAEARPDVAYVGGGSLPDQAMKTWVVALSSRHHPDVAFARRLRLGEPAVLGRIHDGQVLLDVRTIFAEDMESLISAVTAAAAG